MTYEQSRRRRHMSNADFEAGRTAERESIRLALLGCDVCGEIHEPHTHPARGCPCGLTCGATSTSWASMKDGHSYAPRYVRYKGSVGDMIQQLTEPVGR
jgi:hypothetical protein